MRDPVSNGDDPSIRRFLSVELVASLLTVVSAGIGVASIILGSDSGWQRLALAACILALVICMVGFVALSKYVRSLVILAESSTYPVPDSRTWTSEIDSVQRGTELQPYYQSEYAPVTAQSIHKIQRTPKALRWVNACGVLILLIVVVTLSIPQIDRNEESISSPATDKGSSTSSSASSTSTESSTTTSSTTTSSTTTSSTSMPPSTPSTHSKGETFLTDFEPVDSSWTTDPELNLQGTLYSHGVYANFSACSKGLVRAVDYSIGEHYEQLVTMAGLSEKSTAGYPIKLETYLDGTLAQMDILNVNSPARIDLSVVGVLRVRFVATQMYAGDGGCGIAIYPMLADPILRN